ncbi:MAG: FkbM family methyltransferase [Planctomycetota bacterium]
MIHHIHTVDFCDMLARAIPRDAGITVVDAGAHVGAVSARILEAFPNARVHAFEPAPGPFAELSSAGRPNLVPVAAALGPERGEIDLHVTANPHFSSTLRPSALGRTRFEGSNEVVETVRVEMQTLGGYAASRGLSSIDLLKLDVQGAELGVLRGLGDLPVRAVYAEAQLEPAYDGAATLTDIDLFLRGRGLRLHQVHNLMTRGADLQTVQLDALWLDAELLEAVRSAPLEAVTPPWVAAFERTIERVRRGGHGRVAVYGAGTHTRTLAAAGALSPLLETGAAPELIAVVDDDPERQGSRFEHGPVGLPIIGRDELVERGVTAVVLSSDSFEQQMWEQTADLRAAGTGVYRIYAPEA